MFKEMKSHYQRSRKDFFISVGLISLTIGGMIFMFSI